MSNQGIFRARGLILFALLLLGGYTTTSLAATAQSSATLSWASAFSGNSFFNSSYRAGADLTAPALEFSILPSNTSPQSLSYGTAETGSSTFANASSLIVESHATNGRAEADASMTDLILFQGMGAGIFSITADYMLTSFVVPIAGFSSVGIIGSLEMFDVNGNSNGPAVELDPVLQIDDTGLGAPNDLTGMLSLQVAFNENVDFYAVLNLNVFSVTEAAPVTPKTVPIPGGIALLIPALLPLFASRKRFYSNS